MFSTGLHAVQVQCYHSGRGPWAQRLHGHPDWSPVSHRSLSCEGRHKVGERDQERRREILWSFCELLSVSLYFFSFLLSFFFCLHVSFSSGSCNADLVFICKNGFELLCSASQTPTLSLTCGPCHSHENELSGAPVIITGRAWSQKNKKRVAYFSCLFCFVFVTL